MSTIPADAIASIDDLEKSAAHVGMLQRVLQGWFLLAGLTFGLMLWVVADEFLSEPQGFYSRVDANQDGIGFVVVVLIANLVAGVVLLVALRGLQIMSPIIIFCFSVLFLAFVVTHLSGD